MKNIARFAAFALAALPLSAMAQMGPPPRDSELSVTGSGNVTREPDKASFNLSVVTTEDTAAASTSKNNGIYNAVRAKLASAGIPQASIRTQGYNVEYVPRPAKPAPNDFGTRYGYTTNRFLQIETTVDGVGKAIDLAFSAGATEVSNVSFGLRDRKGASGEALKAAVADARSQAEALAAAAGMHIVRVRYITTGSSPIAQPMPMQAMRMSAAAMAPVPTDIRPGGPIDVSATVTVTYVIQ